eukprot:3767333-Pleurochrysis_carterae.AAC.1
MCHCGRAGSHLNVKTTPRDEQELQVAKYDGQACGRYHHWQKLKLIASFRTADQTRRSASELLEQPKRHVEIRNATQAVSGTL